MGLPELKGLRIAVEGTVQGVGFRPWVYQLAKQLDLRGTVKNGPQGVTIDVFAPLRVLDVLLKRLQTELPPAAQIDKLSYQPLEAEAPAGFAIIASDDSGEARASIPADLAMCDACRDEIHDPGARRYRYPFTNCTHCGPRFTLATAVPYDRPRTTMAGFPLCDDCRREYDDPLDRRFHAQPIACPVCGPKLAFLDAMGRPVETKDPLQIAARRLLEGQAIAVRGLGGFHLACDATDDAVVRTLRERKHRDEKPLAVMVPDVETAQRLALLGPAELAQLTHAARPIVLAPMRAGADLAPSVAPGLRIVGLFLPYTPMHELLLQGVKRPLVMTSGNRSDEPMAVDNAEAVERLKGIADGFLVHDRPIANRTDDSVVRIVEGGPVLLRRARGFVPGSLASPFKFDEPVLAVGGQLKNAFCVGKGSRLTLGPHVGDLGELSQFESYCAMLERFERFLEVKPEVLAYDLHPEYDTTWYARQRTAREHVGVQHHHAHVAAVMAEHGLLGPVLGVAFDGTGYGDDGEAWGGEFLLARYGGFERVATLRPLGLAGGEQAIRAPWRLALAALDDAFDGAAPLGRLKLFESVSERDIGNVRQLLSTRFQVTPAHGAGRVFDAAASLILGRPNSAFEAQLAMTLEQTAQGDVEPFAFELNRGTTPWQVDLRPMWRALAVALMAGHGAAELAARVHATLGAATAATVKAVSEHGALPVALAGGCFANARLAREVVRRLEGFQVVLPRQVPCGDGGLALGQAVVAAARLKGAR